MSEAITRGIRVQVQPEYIPEQSDPQNSTYFFAYHVTLSNEGVETVQLVNRHWIITDGEGKIEEVRGPGVIGEQPVLESGESFRYSSFCPLRTPMGSMRGFYEMRTEKGESFQAEIPLFELKTSYTLH